MTLQEIKLKATEEYIKRTTSRKFQNNINLEDGKIYKLISTMVDSISASLTGGGGGGEANTASNLSGSGGIFAQKVGVDLQFKSLIAGDNIAITPSASALSISASSGGSSTGQANTMSNTGTGEGTIYKEKLGDNFVIKSLKAGSNVTITNNTNDIIISAVSIATIVLMNIYDIVYTTYQTAYLVNPQFSKIITLI